MGPEHSVRHQSRDLDQKTDYAAMLREVQRPGETNPIREEYAQAVDRIRKTFEYNNKNGVFLSEAIATAHDIYANDSSPDANQTALEFNAVMIETIPAFLRQTTIERMDKAALENGRGYKGDDRVKALVYRQIEFDHHLRDVIAAGRDQFNRPDITAWLARMAGNSPKALSFSRFVVNGINSELTVMDSFLQAGSEITFARFSTPSQDLKGIDIMASTDQGSFTVDVKSSHKGTTPHWRNGQPHLIVGVDPLDLSDLTASDAVKAKIRSQVSVGLAHAWEVRESLGDYRPRQKDHDRW